MVPDSPSRQMAAETGSASVGSLDPGDVFWESQQNSQPSAQGSRRGVVDDVAFAGSGGGEGMAPQQQRQQPGPPGVNQISLASSWLPLSFESLSASGQAAPQQQPSVFNPTPWDPSGGMMYRMDHHGNPMTAGSWAEQAGRGGASNIRSVSGMLLEQSMIPNYRNSKDASQQRPSNSLDDQKRQQQPPKDIDKRATTRRPHHNDSNSRRNSRTSTASDDEDHHANKKRGSFDKSKTKVEPGHGLGDIDPAILDALPQEDWKTLTSAGVRLAGMNSLLVYINLE